MEFPTDVLTLIREYSKPLPRTIVKECTDDNPCKDYDECSWCCQHIKPCECGCGYKGGSCERYYRRFLQQYE